MNKITDSVILITGGAGCVGSHLTEELLQYNPKKIIIVDNMFRGLQENMKNFASNPVVEFIEGDIRDYDLMDRLISQSDYVYHMAAIRINICAYDPDIASTVMSQATFEIAKLCAKHKVKKVMYSSSASIYGLAQNFPTPETDNPYDNQTIYGAAKLYGEQVFRSFKHNFGLDYVGFRYFNIFGERMDLDGRYTEVMVKWLDCIRDNTQPMIFGDGKDTMDFVYVKDVAKANVLGLLSDATDEIFNIASQKETSLTELLDLLLKVNNSDLEPVFKEANKINPVSRRLADISKAKRLLGFEPQVTLEEGLKILSQWYFESQKAKA